MDTSFSTWGRFQHLIFPADKTLSWSDVRFEQLYQIIQHLFSPPLSHVGNSGSNPGLTAYVQHILGYSNTQGDNKQQSPPLLGIPNLTDRYYAVKELTTMINIPPYLFQTDRINDEIEINSFINYEKNVLDSELKLLTTYAIITNNPVLLTWIVNPIANPQLTTWEQRIRYCQEQIDTINSSVPQKDENDDNFENRQNLRNNDNISSQEHAITNKELLYDLLICISKTGPSWGQFSPLILFNLFISTSQRYKQAIQSGINSSTKVSHPPNHSTVLEILKMTFSPETWNILVKNGINLGVLQTQKLTSPYHLYCLQFLYKTDDLNSFKFIIELLCGGIEGLRQGVENNPEKFRKLISSYHPLFPWTISPKIFHFLLKNNIITAERMIQHVQSFWRNFMIADDEFHVKSVGLTSSTDRVSISTTSINGNDDDNYTYDDMLITLFKMEDQLAIIPVQDTSSSSSELESESLKSSEPYQKFIKFPFLHYVLQQTADHQHYSLQRHIDQGRSSFTSTMYQYLYRCDPDLIKKAMNELDFKEWLGTSKSLNNHLKFLFQTPSLTEPSSLSSSLSSSSLQSQQTSTQTAMIVDSIGGWYEDSKTNFTQFLVCDKGFSRRRHPSSDSDNGIDTNDQTDKQPLYRSGSVRIPTISSIPFIFGIASLHIQKQAIPFQLMLSKSSRKQQLKYNININTIIDVYWVDGDDNNEQSKEKLTPSGLSLCSFIVLSDLVSSQTFNNTPLTSLSQRSLEQFGTPFLQHPLETIIDTYIDALIDGIEEEIYPKKKEEIILGMRRISEETLYTKCAEYAESFSNTFPNVARVVSSTGVLLFKLVLYTLSTFTGQ